MLKRNLAIAALVVMIGGGNAGCALWDATIGASPATVSSASQAAEKALIAAHSLHDGFALTASAAARSGACVNSCATTVKSYVDGSEKLLVDADGLSNPTDIMADVTAATALISDAKGLTK